MTIYILRYSSDGETSHINEGFTSKAGAMKRFTQLKKKAKAELKAFREGGTMYETPPVEVFDGSFDHYARKVTVKTVADLIKLVNNL